MNVRTAVPIALLLLGGLAAACRNAKAPRSAAVDDSARSRVKSFWQAYGEATRLRTGGHSAEAAAQYREALRTDPSHEDSLYYLAACLAELGDYRGAVESYEALVRKNPSSHRGWFQLGVLLGTPQPGAILDFNRARRAFERNVEINREESGPFLRLGELSLYEGKTAEARRWFDTAAGFQSPEGIFRAGFMRYSAGDYRGALPLFRKVLDINARERKISGRGVHSEGDIRTPAGGFTPLERAGIESLVYLYWAVQRLGGYGSDVPGESRIVAQPLQTEIRFERVNRVHEPGPPVPSLRDMWGAAWAPLHEEERVRRMVAILGGAARPGETALLSPVGVVDAARGDFDRDGREDLLVLSWKKGLRLYRGTQGGTYRDATTESGLASSGAESFAMTVLDFDRDGWPDILVAPYAPYVEVLQRIARPAEVSSRWALHLYRNESGKFREVHLPGLGRVHGVVRAVAADFDLDGYPDILLACGGLDSFRLEPSLVLRNDRGRSFQLAAWIPGPDRPVRALGAAARDFDGDGRPDICLKTPDGIAFFRNAVTAGSPRPSAAHPPRISDVKPF